MEEKKLSFFNKNGSEIELTIRKCGPEHAEDVMSLQKRVYDGIGDKDTFVLTTKEELTESLTLDACFGAFFNDSLIAFTLMVVNRESMRNLGFYLDYGPEMRRQCVTYDTTFIDPQFKGYGLQRFFITLKDSYARNLGATQALATVSPDNKYSLQNLLACGFTIAAEKPMYGRFQRCILRKALN
jgi:hypothetical protein